MFKEIKTYGSVCNSKETKASLNREEVLALCIKLFNDGSITPTDEIKNISDFIRWLEQGKKDKYSNLDFLLQRLYPGLSATRLEKEICRCVNQNLTR